MNSLLNISHYSAQFKESYQPQPVEAFLQQLGHQRMDSCTEIRIITPNLRLKGKYVGKTISGYYTDYQAAARDIELYDGQAGVYCSLQPCDPKLLRRSDNRLSTQAKHTTSDQQIVAYLWALLDIDPERPADTASSDQELQLSADLLARIKAERLDPLNINLTHAISGNGVHGLIPIESQLPIDQTGLLVKEILEALDREYSTDQVKVDTSVFNPSRITKVYGTMAIKGDNTEEAPHRRSIWLPAEKEPIVPYDIQELHQALCPAAGKKKPSTTAANHPAVTTDQNLEESLTRHGLIIASVNEKEGNRYLTLEECPFNPDHRRDSAVIQGHDGRIGFNCFHDSCRGKTWSDLKAKLGMDYISNSQADISDSSPLIITNNRPLPAVTSEALSAITNLKPPSVFHMGSNLVRVVINADQDPIVEEHNRDSLKGVMARSANFVRRTEQGDTAKFPPNEVAADILSLPGYPSVPALKGILPYPLITPNGQIAGVDGYDYQTHYIHSHHQQWSTLSIGEASSEVEVAKSDLAEVLQDFKFKDPASWANSMALMLTPFTKLLVEGGTPGFAISAPVVGTGKTLLAKAVSSISLGHEPSVVPEVESEGEQRKQIGALLQTAPIFVLIDNIKKPLSSGSLAAVLTTRYWQDRKLGSSTMLMLQSEAIWVFIGNTLQADPDLSRRLVMIELDTEVERPWERRGFKHTDLMGWVKANRKQLVQSCLTLLTNWVQRGRPAGSVQLGSYESWSTVMSGILEAAGIEGFMANRQALDSQLNLELEAWSGFIHLWSEEFQHHPTGVSDLFPLACSADDPTSGDRPLDPLLGPGSVHQLKVKLGQLLVSRRNQIISGYQLTEVGSRNRAKQWRLGPVEDDSPDSSSHSSLDSPPPEPLKVSQGQEIQSSSTAKNESDESGESKTRAGKNCELQTEIELENRNDISVKQELPDSSDSSPPPLTSPPTSPAVGSEPSESNNGDSPPTHLSAVNQLKSARQSPPPEGTVPPTEFHLLTGEDDIAGVLDDYLKAEVLALDIETTGLDPLTDQIRLVQIAAPDLPVLIIDLFKCRAGLSTLTPLLVNQSVKVIHQAKFELKFLLKNGVEIQGQIFDTMLAEQLLYAGIRGYSSKLEYLAERYLKQALDKEEQNSDWSGDLTAAQLAYAARDAEILLPLREKLIPRLTHEKLIEVAKLEFDCVPAVAQMELAGFKVDENQWRSDCQRADQQVEVYRTKVGQHFPDWATQQGQELNPNSTQQLQLALASQGIKLNSTKKDVLERHRQHPAVADLLHYKKWRNQQSKYGHKILQSIHPQTGRIHAEYNQLGTETGRFSCSKPPLQQIPKRPQVRQCFIAAQGQRLIVADYSQIELRVAAQLSQDQRMIEAYQKGEDLHCLTASLLTETPIEEVTDEQRQSAKAVNFGLLFAMGADGLRTYAGDTYEVEMSLPQAQAFRAKFFASYPDFDSYVRQLKGRKLKQLRTQSGRVRKYNKGYASLTHALNTPIQGTAADILKRALADLPLQLKATKAQIVACIHDEIILEVEDGQAEAAKMILEQVMVKAGEHYLTDVPVVVESVIAGSWAKDKVD